MRLIPLSGPLLHKWVALLSVAASLPYLWSTCGSDQGWGGDYAGYLIQAREIARGHSQIQPYYLYNPGMPALAPPAYPPGFSLLEALFFRGDQPQIPFFIRLNTVLWWLTGLSLFWIWGRQAPPWAAAGAALLFLFNPINLAGKSGILPDVLFALLTWLAIDIYVYRTSDSKQKALLCGLLAGLAWITRVNGVVLLLAIGLHQVVGVYRVFRKKEDWTTRLPELRFAGLTLLTAILLYGILHYGIFPDPLKGSYFDQLQHETFRIESLLPHATELFRTIVDFFQLNQEVAHFHGSEKPDMAAALGGAMSIGLIVLGMFMPGKRREGFIGLFLACSFGLLLAWPMVQGFRYMLPVLAGSIVYLLRALTQVQTASRTLYVIRWLLLPVLFCGEYVRNYNEVLNRVDNRDPGVPEHPINQEAYRYIRENIPDTARIAHHHPLILGLYAERKSMRWRPNPPERVEAELRRFRVDYLLVNNWLSESDPDLQHYLEYAKTRLDTVWHNERNCLFRIKPASAKN